MEDWKVIRNTSGTPQGGILSPLLSNIYLNELDQYVETVLIPKFTRGKKRQANREYGRISQQRHRLRVKGDYSQEKELTAILRKLPTQDPNDPNYRRLHYVRYADDFLLGFAGPRSEAVQIKEELTQFLRDDLNLELSPEKTLITHAGTQSARFLGYDLQAQRANDQIDRLGRRSVNGAIGLRVPKATIDRYCQEYMLRNKPIHIPMLILEEDYPIVKWYGDKLRGISQYYLLAWNLHHLWQLGCVDNCIKLGACQQLN
jgi:hypothetical protein